MNNALDPFQYHWVIEIFKYKLSFCYQIRIYWFQNVYAELYP